MREINAQPEPADLTHWRAASQNDINFGYDLMPGDLRATVKAALVAEQRGLCAYTGIGIGVETSRIEHLKPQRYCERGEDVSYVNLVACFPAPNAPYASFGEIRKGDWPPPAERHLFVSPRSKDCEKRFVFNLRGVISPANNSDVAASITIDRLGLDDRALTAQRKAALDATLVFIGRKTALLDLKLARKRLNGLEDAEKGTARLEPFCFVLKQALKKHIIRLEAIKVSRTGKK